MRRLFSADPEHVTARSVREPEPADDANAMVERKFHDTLEEVFALKQILQEFLADPPERPALPVISAEVVRPNQAALRRADRQEDPADKEPQSQVRASRNSERMLRQSLHFEPDFQARLRYYMRKNKLNREQIQAAVDEKTQEDLKLAPAINQRSKRIHRSVHHLHAWEHEKKLKLEELRQAERRREVEEVTSVPQVSRVSRRMSLNRVDDLAQCKVEDRLHLLGLIYEYQQEERQIEAAKHSAGGAGFKPQLAPHSSKLVRDRADQVHDRLYELAKRQPQQPSELDQQHSPRRTKSKETVDAAIQRLAGIGELYRSKRAEMAQHRELQLKEMQTSQKLSSKSRSLADKVRSKDKERHHRKCPCCRQPEEDDSPEVHIAISSTQAADIYERQRQWLARKEQRCQEERERREAEEAAALAFRNPQYRAAWGPLGVSPQGGGTGDDDEDANNASSPGQAQQRQQRRRTNRSFFEKSTKWAEDREQQLASERQVWDAIHLRDCTFKPTLHSRPSERRPRPQPPSPRPVLRTLDPGFFSRTNLRTPMLDADRSDVSSDDCMSDEEGEADGSEDGELHVVYFDEGERR